MNYVCSLMFIVILFYLSVFFFFFSSRRRHTRLQGDWSSDVCSSDLPRAPRQPCWSPWKSARSPSMARLTSFPGSSRCLLPKTRLSLKGRILCRKHRSEERRVGKECRSRRTRDKEKTNVVGR